MRNTILFSIITLIFATSCGDMGGNGQSEQAEKPPRIIPVKDFFKNPDKTTYRISPDGSHYSYLGPYESRMNIFVQKVGEAEAKRITDVTDRDIAGYGWANDNRLIYMKDVGGDENYQLFAIDKDGSNYVALTELEGVRTGIVDILRDNDDEIIMEMNKRDPQAFDPYRLNIVTGEMTMLAENPGNISSWITDHDGKIRAATQTIGTNSLILYRDTEEEEFRTILETDFKETAYPVFFTFDNKNLYAISNVGRDKTAAVIMSTEDGSEIEKLFEHPEVDLDDLSYSRKRKVLTSTTFKTWRMDRHFFDEETQKIYTRIQSELGDYEFVVTGRNKNEDILIIRSYSDRSLGAYYIYDTTNDKFTKIVDVSDWLNEDELAEMKPIKYQSRDGLTINGYLTLPKGREAKNLPVVINPHGGPWARDDWGFNSQVQFLANRGYAVLQMNFRGSTGYGRAFWEKSFMQWGQTMQDDISDGVQWLIDEGIADPKRVAIYGASYGGYATLAGLTFTPDLYACGIDYVGVANMFTFMKTIPPYWKPYLDMMYEMVGNPVEDSALFHKISPVFHADKIKVPLFVAQGAQDPRVNKDESDQMVNALKERGINVEYLVKDNEGHGFRNEENRFEFYGAMESFLAKHIGDSASTEVKTTM